MVMIAPEEVMAQRSYEKLKGADPMAAWRRELIGNSARLEIPLRDPYIIRKIVDPLAGLVEHLRVTAHRTDISEYDILMSIKNGILACNMRIRELHGAANKNGTYPKR